MRRQNTQGFNKEKLIFLLSSCLFSAGLYIYLASSPVLLEVGKPIGPQSGPGALLAPIEPIRPDVNFYVVDGKISRLMDPITNQLVNRARKNPFAPPVDFSPVVVGPKVISQILIPPPPHQPTDTQKDLRSYGASDPKLEIVFRGIVKLSNGETYGSIQPADSSTPPRRVKVGDVIEGEDGEDYSYTVTKINLQTIEVTDAQMHPFILKDKWLNAESEEAETSGKINSTSDKPEKDPKTDSKKNESDSNLDTAVQNPFKVLPQQPVADPKIITDDVHAKPAPRPRRPRPQPKATLKSAE